MIFAQSLSIPKQDDDKDEDGTNLLTSDELKDSSDSRPITEDPSPPSETEAGSEKTIKNEDDQNEEKILKKPDKIIPCPRCNSMDTKFCYFNNYNVNQPRHFCKNCQRYWTAGGTMRNVPVGAGRRKNKNSISQYRNLTEGARVDLTNGILNPNGTVLTFGSDSHAPLCESMASVLNIVDKTHFNSSRSGEISVSDRSKESGDDSSSRSSTTASSSKDEKKGLPEMVPCYGGGPWPYPWNPMQWNSPLSPPAFVPPTFPMPFFASAPPPYWAWNVPWVMQQAPPNSAPTSPTLGKHSRDETIPKVANTEEEGRSNERNLFFPKTLRIDDPGEAAKSSIWATLGIKNERVEGVGSGGGLFKAAFQTQSKEDEKSHASETSTVLHANPAAFSRSVSFHENS